MPHRFEFDPYSVTAPAVSRVAIFYCGRCLSRIYWHLQQCFLLGSQFDPATTAEQIRNHKAAHLNDAFQVIDTLSTLVGLTKVHTADSLSREIRRLATEWKDGLEPDAFRDAIDNATEELQGQPEEVSPAVYCSQLVKDYVDPLYDNLHQSMTTAFQQQRDDLLNLGIQCERGICRPDVYRFLSWNDCWPVLGGESASLLDTTDPAEEEYHAHVGEACEELPAVRTLATKSFDPGQLAPEDGWINDLRAAWTQAGLAESELRASLVVLGQRLNERALRRDDLVQAVNEIQCLACESILVRSPTVERVTVDVETSRITVDGTEHDVEPHHARMVAEMWKKAIEGTWWVTDTDIKTLPGCKGKNFSREFKALFTTVPSLKPLIVSEKGKSKGRRLK